MKDKKKKNSTIEYTPNNKQKALFTTREQLKKTACQLDRFDARQAYTG